METVMKAVEAKPRPGARPAAGEAPGSDFFYDELMTAQPDAMSEFLRARLLIPAPQRLPSADKAKV
jgi:hypothetical protein